MSLCGSVCSICEDKLDDVVLSVECGHIFHLSCLSERQKRLRICPECILGKPAMRAASTIDAKAFSDLKANFQSVTAEKDKLQSQLIEIQTKLLELEDERLEYGMLGFESIATENSQSNDLLEQKILELTASNNDWQNKYAVISERCQELKEKLNTKTLELEETLQSKSNDNRNDDDSEAANKIPLAPSSLNIHAENCKILQQKLFYLQDQLRKEIQHSIQLSIDKIKLEACFEQMKKGDIAANVLANNHMYNNSVANMQFNNNMPNLPINNQVYRFFATNQQFNNMIPYQQSHSNIDANHQFHRQLATHQQFNGGFVANQQQLSNNLVANSPFNNNLPAIQQLDKSLAATLHELDKKLPENPQLNKNLPENPQLSNNKPATLQLENNLAKNPQLNKNLPENPQLNKISQLENNLPKNPQLNYTLNKSLQLQQLDKNLSQNPQLNKSVPATRQLDKNLPQNPQLKKNLPESSQLKKNMPESPILASNQDLNKVLGRNRATLNGRPERRIASRDTSVCSSLSSSTLHLFDNSRKVNIMNYRRNEIAKPYVFNILKLSNLLSLNITENDIQNVNCSVQRDKTLRLTVEFKTMEIKDKFLQETKNLKQVNDAIIKKLQVKDFTDTAGTAHNANHDLFKYANANLRVKGCGYATVYSQYNKVYAKRYRDDKDCIEITSKEQVDELKAIIMQKMKQQQQQPAVAYKPVHNPNINEYEAFQI